MNYLIFILVFISIIGSLTYHISEKSISRQKTMPLFFVAVSALVTFVVFFIINLILGNDIFVFSLPIILISVCNAIIDVTIIYVYKQGGKAAVITNIQNSVPAIILVGVGILFFHEVVSVWNAIGIAFALFGAGVIVWKSEQELEKKSKRRKVPINFKNLSIFIVLLIVAEVIYQISFKVASNVTETLSAINTIFFLNFLEYFAILLVAKVIKHKKQALPSFYKDFKRAIHHKSSYLFTLANFLIIMTDYLIYKVGGELSKVMNYIAPLETVALLLLGVLAYKDKFYKNELIGIISVLIGIVLIAL